MVPFRPPGVLLVTALLFALGAPAATAGVSNTMGTFAGTGTAAFSGDGAPAIAATFNAPRGMAWLADGSMLVADVSNNRIRKISPAGIITTVAGNGGAASTCDAGCPAILASINLPRDVEVAPDGVTYYIAETTGNKIRKVDASGTMTTVVGTGIAGATGDLGPAGAATLSAPYGLGVASNGDVYFADNANSKIRRVLAGGDGLISASSIIQTVAGTGGLGFTGDLGPATSATMNGPADVLPLSGGEFLIADNANARIRRVDSSGVIRTVAGGTACAATGLCGDGGPASASGLLTPWSLASDRAGGYLIADNTGYRVRRVDAAGNISTVIGTGVGCATVSDRCGDGGPGNQVLTGGAPGVLAGSNGTIYTADSTNRIRVRVLDADQVGATGATGAAGGTGATGATGAAGGTGAAGATGATGAAGATGATGATGPAGATGAAGASGASGAAGAAGVAGGVGPAGADGLSGAAGADGTLGLSGPAGIPGVKGSDGFSLPLFASLPGEQIALAAGGRESLRLYVSGPAAVVVQVFRGGRVVKTATVTSAAGGLVRASLGRLKRGRYRLHVTATSGGETSLDRATLTIG